MASLGGAGESVAMKVGAGELGRDTATLLAGARFTVVAVDRTPTALDTFRNRSEVLAHAVRPEAAANIMAFLVATAPHSSAVRPCHPTAPSPAASHPATPRI